jgi:hypothetical protein
VTAAEKPAFTPPVSFKLGGRTWKVERVEKRGQWLGKCSPSRCRIRLNMHRIKNNEELMHTFMHELLHAVCFAMGWEALNDDEDKIDAMASLLVQVERTIIWES